MTVTDHRGAPVNAEEYEHCWRSPTGKHQWVGTGETVGKLARYTCSECGDYIWRGKDE